MKIKPGKCIFHATETEYVGFFIGREGIKLDPIKTCAIWEWAKPTKVKEVLRFMRFCNFYRRFIEGFSRKARPLYQLTRKDNNWEWERKEESVLNEIRTYLKSGPTLIHFDLRQPITRERRFKLRYRRNPVTTWKGQQAKPCSLSIQDNDKSQMQLWCTRQRVASHCEGTRRVERIS